MAATDGKWTITVNWVNSSGKTAKGSYTIEASTLEKAKAKALDNAKKQTKSKNHKIVTVKTVRAPKTTTQKVGDAVSNVAKNVADDYKFAFGVLKDKIKNTLQKKQLGRAEAFLNAVDSLDNVVGTLNDLDGLLKDGVVKEAIGNIAKVTGKATKTIGVLDSIANLKKCYNLGKKCKAAKGTEASNAIGELMKANLDFLGTVTGTTAKNIVVGKLMDYAVSFGKTLLDSAMAAAKAVKARNDGLDWLSIVGDYDEDLAKDIYRKYQPLGRQLWNNMKDKNNNDLPGRQKCATILSIFIALRAIDDAKSGK